MAKWIVVYSSANSNLIFGGNISLNDTNKAGKRVRAVLPALIISEIRGLS